ncbi:MAG: carbamoyltransferase C-terminal domain-containing protein [Planctomycetota bacterium]
MERRGQGDGTGGLRHPRLSRADRAALPAQRRRLLAPRSHLLGAPRVPDGPLEQRHFDLAASLQVVFEERLLALARRLREKSGESRLACAGGVFLNGVANWRLRTEAGFDAVWVHPVSHDAGAALGAALVAAQRCGEPPSEPVTEVFLGVALGEPDVAALAREAGFTAERTADPAAKAAELIAEGHVTGWVQGRAEIGPRALGARSILADPRRADMKDIVNARVKKREGFRPFAPAVLAERAGEWFADPGPFRHMIVVVPVREDKRDAIPAVVHQDGTGRVQTVVAETNPAFHALISAFAERTGVPVVLNTSFNLRGEPMVQTAADAVDCMRRTELDHCLIGEWWVRKA